MLREQNLAGPTQAYIDKLYYRDMVDSPACWKTAKIVDREIKELKSKSAKLNAIKEQIRIRELGLGWEDWHHAWSYLGEE